MPFTLNNIDDKLTDLIMTFGPNLVSAVLVLVIGLWIAKKVTKAIIGLSEKKGMDKSLIGFLKGLIGGVLKIMVVITAMGRLGIEMTSFVAILGAAGLAVGLALSGTLQNFAGGVMILIFKPFKVGDVIDAQGYVGSVNEISIFNTIMKTPDNKTIIIPNGGLATSSLTNFSTEEKRRVDWTFGIGYGDSTAKAKEVLKRLADADSRILKDPEVFIAISSLGDSSVNFTMRAWVNAADYWGVFFEMNDNVYNTFAAENLSIPYPQMDVHVHKD